MRLILTTTLVVFTSSAAASSITLISKGAAPGEPSTDAGVSAGFDHADRRYAVFSTRSTNLVEGNPSGSFQVVRFDRLTGERIIVSQHNGEIGNGVSVAMGASDDGRYVVFSSSATNLMPGTTTQAIYRKDMTDGSFVRITPVSLEGAADYFTPKVAANGRSVQILATRGADWIAGGADETRALNLDFEANIVTELATVEPVTNHDGFGLSETPNCFTFSNRDNELWLHRPDGSEFAIDAPLAGGASRGLPAISADCRYVVFNSTSTNLIPGVTTSPAIYRFDALNQQFEWVSAGVSPPPGTESSYLQISPDARHIHFDQYRFDAVVFRSLDFRTYYRDMTAPNAVRMPRDDVFAYGVGNSGAFFVQTTQPFDGDRNHHIDLLRATGPMATPELVVGPFDPTPTLSANGSTIQSATAQRSESRDGRFVFFASNASNLVAGADTSATSTDLFVRDMDSGVIQRVLDVPLPINGTIELLDVSGDARFVLFSSTADHLVAGDSNRQRDVFLVDRQTSVIERVNVTSAGIESDLEYGDPGFAAVSDDGRRVVFSSPSQVLSGATAPQLIWYVRERSSGTTRRLWPAQWQQWPVFQFSTDGSTVLYEFVSLCPRFLFSLDNLPTGGCTTFDPLGGTSLPTISTLSRELRFSLFVRPQDGSVWLRDLKLQSARQLPVSSNNMRLSANGRYVEFVAGLGSSQLGLSLYDTLLDEFVTGSATVNAVRDAGQSQGTWLNIGTENSISADDQNALPDLYRLTVRGDGIHGGGWQGGFE